VGSADSTGSGDTSGVGSASDALAVGASVAARPSCGLGDAKEPVVWGSIALPMPPRMKSTATTMAAIPHLRFHQRRFWGAGVGAAGPPGGTQPMVGSELFGARLLDIRGRHPIRAWWQVGAGHTVVPALVRCKPTRSASPTSDFGGSSADQPRAMPPSSTMPKTICWYIEACDVRW